MRAKTSATISWTTDEPATSQVEYGLTSNYGDSTPLDSSMTVDHTQIITELIEDSTYYYRVKSVDMDENLTISDEYTFNTLSTVLEITSVISTEITETSVTILWTTNYPSDSQVEYGLTSSYGDSTTLDSSLTTEHSQVITDLTGNTQYHFKVKSKDQYNNIAESEDMTFTTVNNTVPTITITSPTPDPSYTTTSNSLEISGVFSDDNGVTSVEYSINQDSFRSCSIFSSPPPNWRCSSIDWQLGRNEIIVRARDGDLNEATDTIVVHLTETTYPPVSEFITLRYVSEGYQSPKVDVEFCVFNSDYFRLNRFSKNSVSITDTTRELPGSGCLAFNDNIVIKKNRVYNYRVQGVKENGDGDIESEWTAWLPIRTRYTFDEDLKDDPTVWRPGTGMWYTVLSKNTTGTESAFLGQQNDKPLLGDYDGDGITDRAVYRSGNGYWYILMSSNPGTYDAVPWGMEEDIPVPGDYDGDGKTDRTVWRPSTGIWYILKSSAPGTYDAIQWGSESLSDVPVPADYDRDGKTDIAVYRRNTGIWYILKSSLPGTYDTKQWGMEDDIPVPADYDGDLKADVAVWRPSTGIWYILKSSVPGTYDAIQWGSEALGDIPVPADYDADYDDQSAYPPKFRADIAVFRPGTGTWYILKHDSTYYTVQLGTSGDIPLAAVP